MPRRDDLRTILLIGSGPIVIGQACEFDYSGTQACRALREEGYRVVLINSNPATIMTDPASADETYLEPLTVEACHRIIEIERPEALLPTLGGQTALNLARDLALAGILEAFGVELIGANLEAIERAEDRERFQALMLEHEIGVPRGGFARTVDEAVNVVAITGYPVIVRPAYTLGGAGGGVATSEEEFLDLAAGGLRASPIGEILVEESVIGWKEFELEVMRDRADNCVVVCSIENLDPMGVHTGDSITVAPQQTLSDREYQAMRDTAFKVIRAVGVETGGSNIQFAVDPNTGRQLVIEMNPRVSRSSALASKATGFPIAKIAARLAVGYTLDEIPNDITGVTPASFEPSIDYVVAKVPRFDFQKFPGANRRLTTAMKSVGETMAIGRTFGEAIQKGLRGLETGVDGAFDPAMTSLSDDALAERVETPSAERIFEVVEALRRRWPVERLRVATGIDPWFLHQLERLAHAESEASAGPPTGATAAETLRSLKVAGFSDAHLARVWSLEEAEVRELRESLAVDRGFKVVDTCAGEFEARTPYFYSSYDRGNEARPLEGSKIMILGGGPNRIGQGIEFDYCCVQAALALREAGYRVIMVNCNPETVSTDYDVSDRLYFEPLTIEDVGAIIAHERPDGVLVQYGGQTPLKLAVPLHRSGVSIVGTAPDAIDRCEDRDRFSSLLASLGIPQARAGFARTTAEARSEASRIGYPVLLRPSYVLGGRGMVVIRDADELEHALEERLRISGAHPLLVDEFLENAIEYDVDAIGDGERVVIGGVMQHVEGAGIHSGDSTCWLPPQDAEPDVVATLVDYTRRIGLALPVRGLMNVQYAVREGVVYALEVNPRASRTIPFVSKTVGVPLARLGALVMVGERLADLGLVEDPVPLAVAVKAPALPFQKFPGVDPVLGPEMRSTGEVIGLSDDPQEAYRKAMLGVGLDLREALAGPVLLSLAEADLETGGRVATSLIRLGAEVSATASTRNALGRRGIDLRPAGHDADPVARVRRGGFSLVVITARGAEALEEDMAIRRAALRAGIPCLTSVEAADAAVGAVESGSAGIEVRSLQSWEARARC
ncbi:MAG TPA: carbamoyl-phosphate synthase large subunit, partial [Gemmatimonadota bacterium]|nr:carbamoyl-phosphate synthase large subunit [Gemmatimonadota bacterium]